MAEKYQYISEEMVAIHGLKWADFFIVAALVRCGIVSADAMADAMDALAANVNAEDIPSALTEPINNLRKMVRSLAEGGDAPVRPPTFSVIPGGRAD